MNRKAAYFACLWLAATPALAAEPLLQIIKADGSKVDVTAEDLEALKPVTMTTPLFINSEPHQVRGPLMRDLLAHFGLSSKMVHVTALDDYRVDIPVEDFNKYDVILAFEIDGKRPGVRDKGPTRIVYPLQGNPELLDPIYEARFVWQVKDISPR